MNTFWDILLNNFQADIMIFSRVMGIFAFNPMFARRNIPGSVKIGASLALTIVIWSSMERQSIDYGSLGTFALGVLFETFIGCVLGFLTQLFLSTILFGGDVMDMQSGLGMAKIYDPASGIQMPLFGTVSNYMFVFYFFVTDAHLAYIKIFALSFEIIPVGGIAVDANVGMVIVEYFAVILTLAMKLAIPIVMAQLILEFCMGILMKAVPQIQVMAVNIQVKLLFGMVLLFILAVPMSDFIEKYMGIMLESLEGILPLIAK